MSATRSRRALHATLCLMAFAGVFLALADARVVRPTRLADLLFSIGTMVLCYLWYYFDAAERGFRRTGAMGGAIVLFSVLALPVYLAKSRPQGQRLRAIGALLLFLLACLVLAVVTAIGVAAVLG